MFLKGLAEEKLYNNLDVTVATALKSRREVTCFILLLRESTVLCVFLSGCLSVCLSVCVSVSLWVTSYVVARLSDCSKYEESLFFK